MIIISSFELTVFLLKPGKFALSALLMAACGVDMG